MKKIFVYTVIFVLFIIFLSFFYSINVILGKSMEPNLINKQKVIFRRDFVFPINPKRSDVVLYKRNTNAYFVGRVLGLPNESIRVENGHLYIDDNNQKYRITEEYLKKGSKTKANEEGKWFKINNYSYFIIGDNRDNSILIKEHIVHRDSIVGTLLFKI